MVSRNFRKQKVLIIIVRDYFKKLRHIMLNMVDLFVKNKASYKNLQNKLQKSTSFKKIIFWKKACFDNDRIKIYQNLHYSDIDCLQDGKTSLLFLSIFEDTEFEIEVRFLVYWKIEAIWIIIFQNSIKKILVFVSPFCSFSKKNLQILAKICENNLWNG